MIFHPQLFDGRYPFNKSLSCKVDLKVSYAGLKFIKDFGEIRPVEISLNACVVC
jgi:hypothetical protein